MTLYAVGAEADCFEFVSGQAFAFDTTGGRFEANASRGGMLVQETVSEIELFMPANQTDIWLHFVVYLEALADEDGWIVIKMIDNTNAFRLNLNADGSIELQMWDAAAWAAIDTTAAGAITATTLTYLDLHILRHATTGVAQLYIGGTLTSLDFTGDTAGDATGMGRVHFKGTSGGTNEMILSQVIVASENTVGWKLATNHATGNGANTAWTGDFNDIDEASLDTGNFIQTDANDNVETFANQNINAAYSTYSVKGVAVAVRANNDTASNVGDVQAALRVAATNYFSSDLNLPKDSTDYSRQAIFETNPNTANPWTQAEVNAAEFGVKSVA